jgi:hypothetical protein
LNLFLKIENTDQMIMPFKIVHSYTNQPSDCMPDGSNCVPMLVLGRITDNGMCTKWAIRMPLFQVTNTNEYRIAIYFQEDIVLDKGSNILMTPEQVDDQGKDVTYFYPKDIADFIENPEKYLSRKQTAERVGYNPQK